MSGRLIVCPTPIGNLEDVTLRALRALSEADVIACEDTRTTGKLLARHGIEGVSLVSCHEHNERRRARELAERVRRGETVALASDAGTPGVSDPGYVVIRACVEAGLEVEVLPGASSVVTALVASALPAERWRFTGFLPRKRSELRAELERDGETLIAFESPRRLAATLAALAEIDPQRPVAVCRELTKLHEQVARGTASELAKQFADGTRGEVVLVIGPAAGDRSAGAVDLEAARGAVERLVEAGARRRVAASVVSSLVGLPVNKLYGK
ncbi:MAG: 16S rRNA (cytidine(1402)-2'-O)-methyltransferase [Solirubrobacterales bacterium]